MWVKFNVQQQLMVCSLLCTRPPFKITRIIHVLFLSTTKLKLVLLNQRNKFEFLQNTIGPKFLQKVTCSTKGSLTEKFNREISIRIPIRNWPKFLYIGQEVSYRNSYYNWAQIPTGNAISYIGNQIRFLVKVMHCSRGNEEHCFVICLR